MKLSMDGIAINPSTEQRLFPSKYEFPKTIKTFELRISHFTLLKSIAPIPFIMVNGV